MYNWARAAGLVACANPVALADKRSLADREGFGYLTRDEVERVLRWSDEPFTFQLPNGTVFRHWQPDGCTPQARVSRDAPDTAS